MEVDSALIIQDLKDVEINLVVVDLFKYSLVSNAILSIFIQKGGVFGIAQLFGIARPPSTHFPLNFSFHVRKVSGFILLMTVLCLLYVAVLKKEDHIMVGSLSIIKIEEKKSDTPKIAVIIQRFEQYGCTIN